MSVTPAVAGGSPVFIIMLVTTTKILLVDDEPLALKRLGRYLREYNQSFQTEEASSGIEAVEKIKSFKPDIVFLDIEMPGLNGFEVLRQFNERPFQIIFQTAYDEFAIRAFEEHASAYLLKPFTIEQMHKALTRALNRVADEEKLRLLETKIAEREGYLRRLTVKQGNRLRIIEEKEICCFVSRDHYTCVYDCEARESIADLSLSRLIERLDPKVFQQLHRSNIVRIEAINSLITTRNGTMFVELKNGMQLPVSRSNRKLLRSIVKKDFM